MQGPPPPGAFPGRPNGGPQAPPSAPQQFGSGAPQGYSFRYSQCTGRRKALLIGINYFGQRGQLRGCINDVRNMTSYLAEHFGYKREDMVILTDDQQNPMSQPTKQNILRAMHWLVKDARPNDSLFFHYSGHGGQTKDLDGDEPDGYDEVIYPVDFRQRGHITDDEMHRIMVQPLIGGVRLTAIFDSCHSGTALDLPYIYSTQGILKEPNLAKEAGQGLLGVISSYSQGDLGGVANNIVSFFKKATNGEEAHSRSLATKTSPADVVMLSGSKDDQTSYVFLLLAALDFLFSPRFARLLFLLLASLDFIVVLRLPDYRVTNFSVPTQPSHPKPPAPCPGLSSPPSRRTPSRATCSSSTAFATNSPPDTRRSPSCHAAILSVRPLYAYSLKPANISDTNLLFVM